MNSILMIPGKTRNLPTAKELSKTITVPFCPESKLSGVNHTDFIKKIVVSTFSADTC